MADETCFVCRGKGSIGSARACPACGSTGRIAALTDARREALAAFFASVRAYYAADLRAKAMARYAVGQGELAIDAGASDAELHALYQAATIESVEAQRAPDLGTRKTEPAIRVAAVAS